MSGLCGGGSVLLSELLELLLLVNDWSCECMREEEGGVKGVKYHIHPHDHLKNQLVAGKAYTCCSRGNFSLCSNVY